MFGIKKMKAEIADLQAFEKGVCKIIDGYFVTNEKPESKYATDNAINRFYWFVMSVDDRLKLQGQAISGLLETLVKTMEENETLKVAINAKAKEIETIEKAKTAKATAKGVKSNGI